jgi:hypothetical protein
LFGTETGEITYPEEWRDANLLGSGCPESGGMGTTLHGFDLTNGDALSSEALQPAVDVVAQTAIPAALWQGGYVFETMVLLYPPTVGMFNAEVAEWIVIVQGGWLEDATRAG